MKVFAFYYYKLKQTKKQIQVNSENKLITENFAPQREDQLGWSHKIDYLARGRDSNLSITTSLL